MSSQQKRLLSRREFLRESGLSIGATGLTALVLSTGCGEKNNSATTKTSTTTTTVNTTAKTISTATSSGNTAPLTTSTTSTTIPAITDWPPITASLTPPPEGQYLAPETEPALLIIPERAARVAADRWYSFEHIWVKPLGENQYVIGISEKLVVELGTRLAGVKTTCAAGDILAQGDVFAEIEGAKMNMDLMIPLSGKVLQSHEVTATLVQLFPYTQGWFLVIQLSNPEELNDLCGPRYYVYLSSPVPISPVPAQNE